MEATGGGAGGLAGVLGDVPLYIQMAALVLAVVESEEEQLGLRSAARELQRLSFHPFSQNIRVELTSSEGRRCSQGVHLRPRLLLDHLVSFSCPLFPPDLATRRSWPSVSESLESS